MWFVFALLSAVFAALTSILAKVGVNGVNSNLATAIRTAVVLVMAWGMVFLTNAQSGLAEISKKSWLFLILSGLDTVDKSVVLWYNEEKRTGVFLHGEQLSTARYVRCDVGNSQAVHNRKQGNVGRQRKGYPSISEWRVLDFENGSTMERPAAGIW